MTANPNNDKPIGDYVVTTLDDRFVFADVGRLVRERSAHGIPATTLAVRAYALTEEMLDWGMFGLGAWSEYDGGRRPFELMTHDPLRIIVGREPEGLSEKGVETLKRWLAERLTEFDRKITLYDSGNYEGALQ